MPCATVHLIVARDALRAWETGRPGPFEVNTRTRDAFLHGAMGPDIGFIPGVDRFVSELAHYHRPADLTRAILEGAKTEVQAAFAWGWASHVLGDVRLHPLIGRAVGARLHGDPERRMNAAEDVATHVAIEVGVDIRLSLEEAGVPLPPRQPLLTDATSPWIADALHTTYALRWSPERLRTDHRTAVARTARWPRALRALSRGASGWDRGIHPRRWIPRAAVATLRVASTPGTALHGFARPVIPEPDLVRAFQDGMRSVTDEFLGLTETGLAGLENRNLESGELHEPSADPHPAAVSVREALSARVAAQKN